MNQGPEEEICKDYDMNELQKAIEKYEHESAENGKRSL